MRTFGFSMGTTRRISAGEQATSASVTTASSTSSPSSLFTDANSLDYRHFRMAQAHTQSGSNLWLEAGRNEFFQHDMVVVEPKCSLFLDSKLQVDAFAELLNYVAKETVVLKLNLEMLAELVILGGVFEDETSRTTVSPSPSRSPSRSSSLSFTDLLTRRTQFPGTRILAEDGSFVSDDEGLDGVVDVEVVEEENDENFVQERRKLNLNPLISKLLTRFVHKLKQGFEKIHFAFDVRPEKYGEKREGKLGADAVVATVTEAFFEDREEERDASEGQTTTEHGQKKELQLILEAQELLINDGVMWSSSGSDQEEGQQQAPQIFDIFAYLKNLATVFQFENAGSTRTSNLDAVSQFVNQRPFYLIAAKPTPWKADAMVVKTILVEPQLPQVDTTQHELLATSAFLFGAHAYFKQLTGERRSSFVSVGSSGTSDDGPRTSSSSRTVGAIPQAENVDLEDEVEPDVVDLDQKITRGNWKTLTKLSSFTFGSREAFFLYLLHPTPGDESIAFLERFGMSSSPGVTTRNERNNNNLMSTEASKDRTSYHDHDPYANPFVCTPALLYHVHIKNQMSEHSELKTEFFQNAISLDKLFAMVDEGEGEGVVAEEDRSTRQGRFIDHQVKNSELFLFDRKYVLPALRLLGGAFHEEEVEANATGTAAADDRAEGAPPAGREEDQDLSYVLRARFLAFVFHLIAEMLLCMEQSLVQHNDLWAYNILFVPKYRKLLVLDWQLAQIRARRGSFVPKELVPVTRFVGGEGVLNSQQDEDRAVTKVSPAAAVNDALNLVESEYNQNFSGDLNSAGADSAALEHLLDDDEHQIVQGEEGAKIAAGSTSEQAGEQINERRTTSGTTSSSDNSASDELSSTPAKSSSSRAALLIHRAFRFLRRYGFASTEIFPDLISPYTPVEGGDRNAHAASNGATPSRNQKPLYVEPKSDGYMLSFQLEELLKCVEDPSSGEHDLMKVTERTLCELKQKYRWVVSFLRHREEERTSSSSWPLEWLAERLKQNFIQFAGVFGRDHRRTDIDRALI
ncbi:unnamed protein product [Amoebophrya sp. A120]|nr:unnamed protein product [Amoebophrya sp. A120]|eukprot:GSA120T00000879001.1